MYGEIYMYDTNVMTVIYLLTLAINFFTAFLMFPTRFKKLTTVIILIPVCVLIILVMPYIGLPREWAGIRGVLFLIPQILLFTARKTKIIFGFFLAYVTTVSLVHFTVTLATFLVGFLSLEIYLLPIYMAMIGLTYVLYVFVLIRFGRTFFAKLFSMGSNQAWVLYSIGSFFAFMVMTVYRISVGNTWIDFFMIPFILLSFFTLSFSIVNTQEKSRQEYEAAFARDIISSGRDHYEKLTSLTDRLHVLHHDYHHHLHALQKLIHLGDTKSAEVYLRKISEKTSLPTTHEFCHSRVINALLNNFAERCALENISFKVHLSLPQDQAIDDYDICVLLGNLLENAFTASLSTDDFRYIELHSRYQGNSLGITVKNSFDGKVTLRGGELISRKPKGGNGIRSIRSIVSQHQGDFLTDWEDGHFKACVVLNLSF